MQTSPTTTRRPRPVPGILVLATLGGLCLLPGMARAAEPETSAPAVDFVREVHFPIFERHCLACHGSKRLEGGLRLTARAAALAGGDSGQRAIVPFDAAASRLVKVINGTDAELKMPPADEGAPLDSRQIEILTRWVSQGAAWPAEAEIVSDRPAHWAWKKPSQASLPSVRRGDWPRRPIDYFVLAPLEQAGIAPAAEADRYTLARRVYLDLIGLPPTPEQLSAYVDDPQPGAYERMVDRALADPGYGERWARRVA